MVNGQSSQSTTALDHALAYARAGWPVVPLRTPGDRLPDGGIAKGKEARVSLHEATTDTATIERWWPPGSRSGIGVVPGKAGMVVLDVDVAGGKTGELELQALEAKHGPLPGTLEQRTPSGGRHLFFKLPEGVTGISNRKIDGCPSIDVRGHTGYVATEGTTTDRGGYQFLDWSPTEEGPPDVKMAPAWLVELLTAPAQSKGTTDTEPRKPMSERHAAALRDILTGADYHGSMTYLAASLVATGMGQGAVVTHLKALVEQSTPTEPARVSRRTSLLGSRELSRIVEWAVNNPKFKLEDQSERSEPWDEVDIADLDWVEPPPPEQVWGALVPAGVVTLFGAHGGKGKSLIGLMLCVCVALGRCGRRCEPAEFWPVSKC